MFRGSIPSLLPSFFSHLQSGDKSHFFKAIAMVAYLGSQMLLVPIIAFGFL
jgi:hypothetical protein